MKFKKNFFAIIVIIINTTFYFNIVFSICQAQEDCGSSINWGNWDEKSLLKSFEAGTIDPCFRKFFDRDPLRTVPSEKRIIVAPADGRILEIKFTGNRVVVRIFLSLWDIHIQRIPLSGKIVSVEQKKGKYLPTNDEKHVVENYQVITTIDTEIGLVKITQIAGFHANRIKTFVQKEDKVEIGSKLGRILLGSTVLLDLPSGIFLKVVKDQKVYGAETIIGRY